MRKRDFGSLGPVSALTLGGGGIGQVWGPTTREESVATVVEAVESGIDFLDVAPGYGNGEAELAVGEAFQGRLPQGVRVSTKCRLGSPDASEVAGLLTQSLDESLARMKLDSVDLFFIHNMIIPDDAADLYQGTPRSLFIQAVRPALEDLRERGRIGAWGITGIGVPDAIIETLREDPPPVAVQAISNLLDSPGALKRYDALAIPRRDHRDCRRQGRRRNGHPGRPGRRPYGRLRPRSAPGPCGHGRLPPQRPVPRPGP